MTTKPTTQQAPQLHVMCVPKGGIGRTGIAALLLAASKAPAAPKKPAKPARHPRRTP